LLLGFAFQHVLTNNIKALDNIRSYYGEKFAFYFAYLIHYTHFLLYPSLVGLIFFIIQNIQYLIEMDTKTYLDCLDSPLNPLYSIFIAIWSTCFFESWKRKEAYLADRWLVRDFNEISYARKEFKCSYDFDVDLHNKIK